ncbi:MAG: peroxidase family protein [Bacteroidota bacterium]
MENVMFKLPQWTPNLIPQLAVVDFFNMLFASKTDGFMRKRGRGSNKLIPAGYTYLGQFIIHDMSFNAQTHTDAENSNFNNQNLRTPSLDLDSIYGKGTLASFMLYDHSVNKNSGRTHFLIDVVSFEYDKKSNRVASFFDLPRKCQRSDLRIHVPIIPDLRNDEHILLSQLHLTFLLFHNKAIDKQVSQPNGKSEYSGTEPFTVERETTLERMSKKEIRTFHGGSLPEELFESIMFSQQKIKSDNSQFPSLEAFSEKPMIQNRDRTIADSNFNTVRKEVKKHFHWLIIHDYLPKIVGKDLVEKIIAPFEQDKPSMKLDFYKKTNNLEIPLEFSIAAFRFGHSMVKSQYIFSDFSTTTKLFRAKKTFTKLDNTFIDWSLFFSLPSYRDDKNNSFFIEPFISRNMQRELPDSAAKMNIAFRNMIRSYSVGLPSGQAIAKEMKLKPINYLYAISLDSENISILEEQFCPLFTDQKIDGHTITKDEAKAMFIGFINNSPLWFYILMEAMLLQKGKQLGPVGGRIIAEVILGILEEDDDLFLKFPGWRPKYFLEKATSDRSSLFNTKRNSLEIKEGGDNSMIEFLKFAGVYHGAFLDGYKIEKH